MAAQPWIHKGAHRGNYRLLEALATIDPGSIRRSATPMNGRRPVANEQHLTGF